MPKLLHQTFIFNQSILFQNQSVFSCFVCILPYDNILLWTASVYSELVSGKRKNDWLTSNLTAIGYLSPW